MKKLPVNQVDGSSIDLNPTTCEPLCKIIAQLPVWQNRCFVYMETVCASPLFMTVADFNNVEMPVVAALKRKHLNPASCSCRGVRG